MKRLLNKFYLLLFLAFFTASNLYSQDEFQRIEANITSYIKTDAAIPNLKKDLIEHNNSIQNNGSWLDIDYLSKTETNWAPLLHLGRIKQFALSIALNDEFAAHHKNLVAQTITALRYWLQANPTSNNWFQNEIASPTAIGEILMLSKGRLPSSLQDSLLVSMKQGNVEKAIGASNSYAV
jgi:chondroitin AC lyase